jgi:putative ABC transport system permease protein
MIKLTYTSLKRNVRLGIKNLLLHKLRSILTMLGLVFGVGSVIAMLAIGEGASEEALERIRMLGSKNIIITSIKPNVESSEGKNTVRLSVYGLLYRDAKSIEETIPTISTVVPVKSMDKIARFKNRAKKLRVVGTTEDWFELVDRKHLAGRKLSSKDVAESVSVAVLTESGVRKLLASENAIGEFLRIGGNSYEVIGVVKSEQLADSGMQMPDREADVYIPITTARLHYGDINSQNTDGARISELVELNQIIVEVASEDRVEVTAETIERVLAISHKKKDYDVNVPLSLLRQAEATKRTFSIVLGAIAGISLLVGGIGIMNIMLATVTERTREIGIRRAIGAKRHQIIMQFLIETLVLSITGGIIGVGFGLLIPFAVTKFAGMPTVVTMWNLVLSLGISTATGIIFGLYPAIRAAKLDPIIALRHE